MNTCHRHFFFITTAFNLLTMMLALAVQAQERQFPPINPLRIHIIRGVWWPQSTFGCIHGEKRDKPNSVDTRPSNDNVNTEP